MPMRPPLPPTRYGEVAADIIRSLDSGALAPGDRLPSVRTLSARLGVGVNTVKEAYLLLESQRLVEARPQSGWYVRRRPPALPDHSRALPPQPADPRSLTMHRLHGELQEKSRDGSLVSLAIALPDPRLLPAKRLGEALAARVRADAEHCLEYQMSPGFPALRAAIARHYLDCGLSLSPDELIITSGGSEAVYLAVLALCQPGDLVAVESPTYFNFLHLLIEMGIGIAEIPCSPEGGPRLDILEERFASGRVKAFLSIPSFSNPLGHSLGDSARAALVGLARCHGVTLIEDDTYGDLNFGPRRPTPCKAWDDAGEVILVSSFSKTLAPGWRIGWIAPGRHYAKADRLKSLASVATATPTQAAMADWLDSGGYPRHLRSLRRALADQTGAMAETVAAAFPPGTRVSRPEGGFVLWVELPHGADAETLFRHALAEGILFSPGALFSASGAYGSCLRLNAGIWNPRIACAVERLGQLAHAL